MPCVKTFNNFPNDSKIKYKHVLGHESLTTGCQPTLPISLNSLVSHQFSSILVSLRLEEAKNKEDAGNMMF